MAISLTFRVRTSSDGVEEEGTRVEKLVQTRIQDREEVGGWGVGWVYNGVWVHQFPFLPSFATQKYKDNKAMEQQCIPFNSSFRSYFNPGLFYFPSRIDKPAFILASKKASQSRMSQINIVISYNILSIITFGIICGFPLSSFSLSRPQSLLILLSLH